MCFGIHENISKKTPTFTPASDHMQRLYVFFFFFFRLFPSVVSIANHLPPSSPVLTMSSFTIIHTSPSLPLGLLPGTPTWGGVKMQTARDYRLNHMIWKAVRDQDFISDVLMMCLLSHAAFMRWSLTWFWIQSVFKDESKHHISLHQENSDTCIVSVTLETSIRNPPQLHVTFGVLCNSLSCCGSVPADLIHLINPQTLLRNIIWSWNMQKKKKEEKPIASRPCDRLLNQLLEEYV